VSSPNVLLPDVVGQPRDQATATLSAKGITAAFVEEDSDQPPGTVLLMFPAAGTAVPKADARVGLQVAREPPIPVPDVVGQEAVPAAALLTQAGFQVTSRNDPSDTVPVGRVIGTDPPPGTPVPRGGNVTVLVSSGPDLIEIPNVVGQLEAPAIAALTGAGFNVTITYQNAGVPNRGKVLSQSPTGGRAPRLATVNITVGN
jgi:serine/threonine-protein kinase